jgi:hypothetical protein
MVALLYSPASLTAIAAGDKKFSLGTGTTVKSEMTMEARLLRQTEVYDPLDATGKDS